MRHGRSSLADFRDGGDAEPLHVIVRSNGDVQVSKFFRRLSVMYTMCYHAHYFGCPILFVVPPLPGISSFPTERIQPLLRLKPGRQADLGQSNDKTNGTGHIYQGRFKSFLIQNNEQLNPGDIP